MKKLLAFILTLVLLVSAVPLGAFDFSVSAATSGCYTYTVSNGEATITDVDNDISGNITIPSTLGGYPVTSIGVSAFYGCTSLTSINIPNGVTSIGNDAFHECESLTSVSIPNSVTSIGSEVFSECASLISISIPNNVTSIEGWSFYGCTSLTNISIGNSVASIAEDAFNWCMSLTSINVNDGNSNYCDIDGVLFNKDATNILTYPAGKTNTKYTIPNSVTNIGKNAFLSCESLLSITIPNSVTGIGDDAFDWCESLTDVYYRGSKTDKAKVVIGSDNTFLLDAVWHYNSCINAENHTFDNSCDAECNVCGLTRDADHIYDDETDMICNICGSERPPYVSGDISDDGKINNKDLGLLMQYINNWNVQINVDAADVNADNKINNKDYGILLQYINNWDVKLQ